MKLLITLAAIGLISSQAHAATIGQTKRIDRLERKLDTLQATLSQFLNEQHDRSEKLSKLKACYSHCKTKFVYEENEPDYIEKERRSCFDSCTDRYEPKDFLGD